MDENGGTAAISADEFAALESKVLQTVELVRKEREARAAAEEQRDEIATELAVAREQLHTQTEAANETRRELKTLHQERDAVRQRMERMLQTMNELL